MITATELAWAAGFFEGEGSIMLLSNITARAYPRLSVEISQIDREPLDWLHQRWGGPIYERPSGEGGNRHNYYRWALTANKAVPFLADIAPFIVRPIVKARIELGIAYQAQRTATWENRTVEYGDRQRDFARRMADLNQRADLTESQRLP